jgi:hypothetical protein
VPDVEDVDVNARGRGARDCARAATVTDARGDRDQNQMLATE